MKNKSNFKGHDDSYLIDTHLFEYVNWKILIEVEKSKYLMLIILFDDDDDADVSDSNDEKKRKIYLLLFFCSNDRLN
jgi:hypothetical protein